MIVPLIFLHETNYIEDNEIVRLPDIDVNCQRTHYLLKSQYAVYYLKHIAGICNSLYTSHTAILKALLQS